MKDRTHIITSILLEVQNSGIDGKDLSLALSKGLEKIQKVIKDIAIEIVEVDGNRDYTPLKKNDLIATTTAAALNNLRQKQLKEVDKL